MGTVKALKIRAKFINAKPDELIPAVADDPKRTATFEVARVYRGQPASELDVSTGVGGGDCGYPFVEGQKYLVDAYKDSSGRLSTGICRKTTDFIADSAAIRYLEGESPKPEDLVDFTSHDRTRSSPDHYSHICGRVSVPKNLDEIEVLALEDRNGRLIPIDSESAGQHEPQLCIDNLEPGTYVLELLGLKDQHLLARTYFPQTSNKDKAERLSIRAGETLKNLRFALPEQKTYLVSGHVHVTSDAAAPHEAQVLMLNPTSDDLHGLLVAGPVPLASDGSFTIQNVPAGEYQALVIVQDEDTDTDEPAKGPSWRTRKVEVNVTSDLSGITLELVPPSIQ